MISLKLDPAGATVFNSEEFSLHVGTAEYSFDDAAVDADNVFVWTLPGLAAWSSGDTFTVKITRTPDTEGPEFESAVVPAAGTTVVITFDEDLEDDATKKPTNSEFKVTVDDTDHTPSSFSVSRETVTLALGTTIWQGQTVTVSYTDPTTGNDTRAIQDEKGNDAPTFSDEAVTNNSTQDITPPKPSRATVNSTGGDISLVFDEDLDLPDTQFLPAAVANAFTVIAGGRELTVGVVGPGVGSERRLVVLFPTGVRIYRGETVTLSYDRSEAGTDALEDDAGNEVEDFTTGQGGVRAVVNNSTQDPPAPTKPTGLTATPDGTNAIDLSWTAPSGSVVTGYKIEVSSDGGNTFSNLVANTNTPSTRSRHSGLSPRTTRHYRVSAINSTGTSPASDTAQATTASSAAPAPSSATAIRTGITLVFNKALDLPTGEFLPSAVASAFTVRAGGRTLTVGAVSHTGSPYRRLELRLSGNMRIYRGERVAPAARLRSPRGSSP